MGLAGSWGRSLGGSLGRSLGVFEALGGGVLVGSWGLFGGPWGPLGGVLEGSSPQNGLKGQKHVEKSVPGPPLGRRIGAQSRAKPAPRAIQNGIVFLINLQIDFWSDLVPTWLHLGPQNPPKMGPSWFQNRSKLEC